MNLEGFLLNEEIVIALLFAASIVGIFARRYKIPYTVGLVIVGLILTLLDINETLQFTIEPEVILGVLIPPLVFEAAYHIQWGELRRNLGVILALAIPGVIFTMLMVGGIITWGTGIAFPIAMLFGALIAATDPVAVVALFRSLGAPKRLQILLEGESLFNDGTAIVIYGLVLSVLTTVPSETTSLTTTIFVEFGRVVGGGIIVGVGLGAFISLIIARVNEPLIETALTTVLAYGAYIMAEELAVSGVLAVVAAGLMNGNVGTQGMAPKTQIAVYNFWEYAAFLANSFAFLVIGLAIDLRTLSESLPSILLAIVAVVAARAVVIYGFTFFIKGIPLSWRHILLWGGLRGAISLALALSLPVISSAGEVLVTSHNSSHSAETSTIAPEDAEEAVDNALTRQLQAMAFGVVLFTLMVQGTTMQRLVRRTGVVKGASENQMEYERRHARAVAAKAAYEHLKTLNAQGLISAHTWETISPLLWQRSIALSEAVRDIAGDAPDVHAEELDTAWREKLSVQRSVYTKLRTDGVLKEETYAQLISEVSLALTQGTMGWADLIRTPDSAPVTHLLAAVIQEKDYENVVNRLSKLGYPVTQLPSLGGYLGRRNATLLVGVPQDEVGTALTALRQSASNRVTFDVDALQDIPLPLPAPTRVTVGGVTAFMFRVARYEEF